ncbi:MAG: PAS domain S-box protein [Candidatus Saccharimonadaceae bacterium]
METKDLDKTQFIEQIKSLQEKVNSLHKTISAQSRTEDALKTSEKNLSAILEKNADGILIVNTEGTVLYMNPAAEKLFGRNEEEFIGNSFGFPVSEKKAIDTIIVRKGNLLIDVDMNVVPVQWENQPAFQLSLHDFTDRNRAKDALIESEKEFRLLSESMPQIVWIARADGWNIYFNQHWADYTGLSLEESYGNGWSKPFHPDDQQNAWDAWQNAVTNNGIYSIESRLRRKDGIYRWWLVRAVPILDGNNKIIKWYGTCTDINELKKSEEVSKINEARMESLLRISQHSYNNIHELLDFALNEAIELTESKIGYIYLYNESRKEFTLNTWSKEVMPQCAVDQPATIYKLEKTGIWGEAVRQRKPIVINDFTSQNPLKKGVPEGHVSLHKFLTIPVFIDDSIMAVVSVANKQTDYNNSDIRQLKLMMDSVWKGVQRKQAEEELNKSFSLLTATFEATADAILVVDNNGRITNYNRKFIEYWHVPDDILSTGNDEKAIAYVLDQLVDPVSFLKKMKVLSSEDRLTSFDLIEFKDGRTLERFSQSQKLGSKSVGRVWSFREITEKKKMLDDLVRAKERAEESDNLKTAFLNNISHEIRTPMNAIVGFAGLLNEPDVNFKQRKSFTEIIIKSSDQLLSIITDLVRISTIEAGQEKPQETDININLICGLLNEQYTRNAKNTNVKICLQTFLGDDDAIIITDGTKLTQILINLIDNALKFTKQGFVNFGYTLKDSQLEFYVEDSGIGIPCEMYEEIFKRFRQVEITSTRNYGGSGLGLAISKAYVEMLGGKIWVTSETNKGSIFHFTIPYKKANLKEFSEKHSDNELKFEFEKQKTLLIAEDEDSNFMLLEILFSDMKIIIIRAINGIEAVEKCKSNPQIDLVLMDIKMPQMDGFEATKQIKAFRADLSIIAQTAFTSEEDKNKIFACGCDDFIGKPINKKLLLEKVIQHLK